MFCFKGKKLFLKQQEFKEFSFEITTVLQNNKYVVVVGKDQVFYSLSKSKNFKEIPVKCTRVAFHPFSTKILLLLGFKLFVYNLNLDKVESDFALTGSSSHSFSAYSSPLDFIIKDFTVYVLYEDARVESLCPVAPREFYITFKKLLKIKNLGGYWAKKWLDELLNQVKSSMEHEEKLLSDQILVVNPKVQGKTGLEKVEIDFLRGSVVNSGVSEIFSVDITIDDYELELFFISYSNGIIHIFMQDLPMVPLFKGDKLDFVPKWILLEEISLDLDENQDTDIHFVSDPKYSNVIYAYHNYGFHRIDFSEWKEKISCVYQNSTENLENLFSSCQSLVEWAMTTFDKDIIDPVLDLKVLSDFEYGYSFWVYTKSEREFRDILPIRPIKNISPRKKSEPQMEIGLKEPFKIPTFPKLAPTSLKFTGKYPDEISETFLKDFTKEVVRLRDHLSVILQGGLALKSRLEQIVQEHEDASGILSSATAFTSSKSDQELSLRLKEMVKRQKKLESKAVIILQILMDQTQPALNSAEKEWFSELKQLAILIKKKISLAIDDINTQKDLIKSQIAPNPTPSSLGLSQTSRIQESLAIEYDLIARATKKAQELADRFNL